MQNPKLYFVGRHQGSNLVLQGLVVLIERTSETFPVGDLSILARAPVTIPPIEKEIKSKQNPVKYSPPKNFTSPKSTQRRYSQGPRHNNYS